MIEGVVVTGGEPSIYDDLPEFIKRLKKTGIKVKLDTNGANSLQMGKLLRSNLLDYVALDIKTSLSKYSLVTDMKDVKEEVSESIRKVMSSQVPYEFRTTCVPGIIDEGDFAMIGKLVKDAKKYCLQQFQSLITLDEKFQNLTPYPKETLKKFRDILLDFVEEVELRGI
jgi:pyruvate formate lyase activating enzyme